MALGNSKSFLFSCLSSLQIRRDNRGKVRQGLGGGSGHHTQQK